MANRHFAKFGDVWKHLPLVEDAGDRAARRYWESHAGSAVYPMVDDPERRYGVGHFAEAAPRFAGLALPTPRYRHHLLSLNGSLQQVARYPGFAMLAMLELRASWSYRLYDLDPESARDLRTTGGRLGLDEQVDVREQDGMQGLQHALSLIRPDDVVVVHVDPYDPWDLGPSRWSALDLAAAVITAGAGLFYWYGYDRPADRGWALSQRAAASPGEQPMPMEE